VTSWISVKRGRRRAGDGSTPDGRRRRRSPDRPEAAWRIALGHFTRRKDVVLGGLLGGWLGVRLVGGAGEFMPPTPKTGDASSLPSAKSPPRYISDEPPGTGILGGRRIDLHLYLKQPIDAEAALGIRPDAQPASAEERAERRAALIRVASLEGHPTARGTSALAVSESLLGETLLRRHKVS